MAVNIPVIVDIDAAFREAASRVKTAMAPLQRQLDRDTLKLHWDFSEMVRGVPTTVTIAMSDLVRQIKQGDDISKDWARVMREINKEMKSIAGAENPTKAMKDRFANLAEARQYLLDYLASVKQTDAAIRGMGDTLEALNAKLAGFRNKLNTSKIGSAEWNSAARSIAEVSAQIEKANAKLAQFGKADGSIDKMNLQLQELRKQWNALGSRNFMSDGSLSKQAQDIQSAYARIASQVEEQSRRLSETLRQQQEREQKERDDARLRRNATTLNELYEQERILSDRLKRATIGSTEFNQTQSQLEQIRQRIAQITGQTNRQRQSVRQVNDELRTQGGVLSGLANFMSYYVSIYAAVRFVKKIRDVTAELEYQRIALGNLIQDMDYGNRIFKQAQELAVESPFRILDISKFTKQLAAYQVDQYSLIDTTKRLADVSAGLGVEMNRLILAYGQVRAASVLRGQELRQFTEAGIPLVQLLAEKFTDLNGKATTTADVFKLISERAVPFEMVAEIFEDMTDAGGMFYNMQAKQAETLRGRWAKLIDVYDLALQRVGESKTFTNANDRVLKGLNALAKHIEIIPKAMAGATYAFIAYKAAMLVINVLNGTAAARFQALKASISQMGSQAGRTQLQLRLLAQANARLATANNALSKTFLKLWIAMLSNPIAAVIAAVAGVIAMILTFRKRTEDATSVMEKFDEVIENTTKALKEYSKNDKLISRYEQLTSATDRTVKQQTQLLHTLGLLEAKFPSVTKNADGTTEELEKQVAAMRQLNEENLKNAKITAETTLGEIERERDAAQKEVEKLYRKRNEIYENQKRNVYGNDTAPTKQIEKTNKAIVAQEENLRQLQKRYESLYYLLNPETQNSPLNAWQQAIYDLSTLNLDGVSYSLFTLDEVRAFETLNDALKEVEKRKKKAAESEKEYAEAQQTTSGGVREQIEAEEELYRQQRIQYEQMEDLFSLYTDFAGFLKADYASALQETYDPGVIETFYSEIRSYMTPYVARPLGTLLPTLKDLMAAGWKDATDILQKYEYKDSEGNSHTLTITPVLPNGEVVRKDELDAYVKSLVGSESPIDADKEGKKLIIGVDLGEGIDDKLKTMLDELNGLVKGNEVQIGRFLVTDDDLKKLTDATDLIDMVDTKIASVEKELRRIDDIKLENLTPEQLRLTENYSVALNNVYTTLMRLRAQTENYISDIAEDFQNAFPELLMGIHKVGSEQSVLGLFSKSDIEGVNSIIDLQSLWSSKIKKVRDEMEKYSKTLSNDIPESTRENAKAAIDSLQEQLTMLEEVAKRYGFIEKTKDTGGDGYTSDPWVLLYKNRQSFVKDFREEVEKLNQTLSRTGAIAKTRELFEGRGLSLGFNGKSDIDVRGMEGSMEEVEAWYTKAIENIKKRIKSLGGKEYAGLGVQQILAKDITNRTIKGLQDLLADLWKEFTGIKADDLAQRMERELEEAKKKLKQSEAARKFYDDILDSTGNEDLATTLTISVYGDFGKTFADDVQRALDKVYANLDKEDQDFFKDAFTKQDFDTILANLDRIPEKWHATLQELAQSQESLDSDFLKTFIKNHTKALSFADRENVVYDKTRQTLAKLIEMHDRGEINDEQFANMWDAADAKQAEDIADIEVEALKDTYEWTKSFEDLDAVSTDTLEKLTGMIKRVIDLQGASMSPEALKTLTQNYENAMNKLIERNPVQALVKELKKASLVRQYQKADKKLTKAKGPDGTGTPSADTVKDWNAAKKAIEEYNETADDTEKIDLDHLADVWKKIRSNEEKAVVSIQDQYEIITSLASALSSVWDNAKEVLDLGEKSEIDGMIEGAVKGLQAVASILPVITALQAVWNAVAESNPYVALAAVIIAALTAIAGLIKGMNEAKNNRLKNEIDDLQEHVDALTESFDKLKDAEDRALGSDYVTNYKQERANLEAQKKAAEQQLVYAQQMSKSNRKMRSERQQAIDDATDAINEVNEKLKELEGGVSEYITGTDVTSAAQDFAKSWLDAYASFSNTSEALKEEFNDMVQSMVVNSVMAQAVQSMLQPFFDEIDRRAEEHGGLTPEDIEYMASQTADLTEMMNASLTAYAERLKAAGFNIRSTASSMSGISKEIASASEESIQGLAAGINTQNYYMSYMPGIAANVAAILAAINGQGATRTETSTTVADTATIFGDETFRGQMNRLDMNIAELLSIAKSVTQPKGTGVATRTVAVKNA